MMVFLQSDNFHGVPCPNTTQCSMLKCMFDHGDGLHSQLLDSQEEHQRPSKRRKISLDETTPVRTLINSDRNSPPHPSKNGANGVAVDHGDLITNGGNQRSTPVRHEQPLKPTPAPTANRNRTTTISPPPVRRTKVATAQISVTGRSISANVTLNPRMIANDPAGHSTRTLYLKKLHEEMARLNNEAALSNDPNIKAITISDVELIILALNEEEKIALENPLVYANVLKQRMMLYKKMKLDQWVKMRLQDVLQTTATQNNTRHHRIALDTGLSTSEELLFLPKLLADQNLLGKHGLVNRPPTNTEITEAKAGVEAAKGWEKCDRCDSRFQVFPDRDEEGALTSGGECRYHHGRVLWPDRNEGPQAIKEKTWSCCGQVMGTSGCTYADTHVFKISDAKRLAALLQFEQTPDNPNAKKEQAVSFDCEMGYTVHGLELIRVTAVSWPVGEELLDVLVRPLGSILDLNSRYSGITPQHMVEALPYDPGDGPATDCIDDDGVVGERRKILPRIVPSPMAARTLLFNLISPSTPLIGHAIENDLNVMRIVHPCIIDTVMLYPHPRGLPMRRALKTLAKQILSRDIQMGGAAGHDSKEDAIATGDLVRAKVASKWKSMQLAGWSLKDGKLVSPANGKETKIGAKK